jgi:hypothetical protein
MERSTLKLASHIEVSEAGHASPAHGTNSIQDPATDDLSESR